MIQRSSHFCLAVSSMLALCGCDALSGTSGPASLAELPELPVAESFRIGSLDGPDALGSIVAITLDREGRVHLLDRQAQAVRVFSPGGDPLGTLGGPGDGPGEFSAPTALGWWGDTLWVWDAGPSRLTRFHDGVRVGEETLPIFDAPGEEFPVRVNGPLPDGSWMASRQMGAHEAAIRGEDYRIPTLRLSEPGVVGDTLWTRRYRAGSWVIMSPSGAGSSRSNPFNPDPIHHIDWGGGSVVSVSHELEPEPRIVVARRTFDGEEIRRTSFPFEPDPLTAEEVDAAVAYHVDAVTSGPFQISASDLRPREMLVTPTVRRPFQQVRTGVDGTLWLRLTPTAAQGGIGPFVPTFTGLARDLLGGDRDGSRWVVFSVDDEPEARVDLPARFIPMWIDGNRVVGVQPDDLDVQYVVGLEVGRP